MFYFKKPEERYDNFDMFFLAAETCEIEKPKKWK